MAPERNGTGLIFDSTAVSSHNLSGPMSNFLLSIFAIRYSLAALAIVFVVGARVGLDMVNLLVTVLLVVFLTELLRAWNQIRKNEYGARDKVIAEYRDCRCHQTGKILAILLFGLLAIAMLITLWDLLAYRMVG